VNFYKHYIGDFQRDTSHLSLTERGAYLALMHHYYATERPLPTDMPSLCRIAGAVTKQEKEAVKTVTAFFESRNGCLWHKRIEAELEKHEGRSDKNRIIALDREARKRAEREEHERTTNRAPEAARNVHETCNEPCQERGTNEAPTITRVNTEAKASGVPPDPIFGDGLAFLVGCGENERGARAFLGKLRKAVGDLEAVELLATAQRQRVSSPIPWLRAAAERRLSSGRQNGVAL
jgi:uncharacterized protein YdaU (DUF1376 family)